MLYCTYQNHYQAYSDSLTLIEHSNCYGLVVG
jgi:hypothetical protein